MRRGRQRWSLCKRGVPSLHSRNRCAEGVGGCGPGWSKEESRAWCAHLPVGYQAATLRSVGGELPACRPEGAGSFGSSSGQGDMPVRDRRGYSPSARMGRWPNIYFGLISAFPTSQCLDEDGADRASGLTFECKQVLGLTEWWLLGSMQRICTSTLHCMCGWSVYSVRTLYLRRRIMQQ